MATRKDIREAFYTELETALDGLVPAGRITGQYPEREEMLPAVVHTDDYRPIPMNFDTAPAKVENTGDGTVKEYYSILMQAQFGLSIVSTGETEKEPIYEALRSHFEDYNFPHTDVESIHGDVENVDVLESTSIDDEGETPTIHGDDLTVQVDYERFSVGEAPEITDVDLTTNVSN